MIPRLKKVQMPIYLEPAAKRALQALSRRTRIPMQSFLREGVDYILARYRKSK